MLEFSTAVLIFACLLYVYSMTNWLVPIGQMEHQPIDYLNNELKIDSIIIRQNFI